MLGLLQPLGLIIGSWLLFFLLFSGLGMSLQRALRIHRLSGWRWLDAFWLGWALTLLILQVWHLAFPVNDAILLLLAIASGWSLLRWRRDIAPVLRRLSRDRAYLVMFGVLLLWFASRAIEMPAAYDTGFRDIQAVQWAGSYAIVPGLANLFSSLAYNHSSYLFNALLDFGPMDGRALHIANPLLLMVYLAYALRAALQLWRERGSDHIRWSWLFAVVTIPYILYFTVGRWGISHLLTDTVVDLLGFLTLIYLLDFAQDWRPGASSHNLILRLALTICAGFTVKHSYSALGLACAAMAAFMYWRRGGFQADARGSLRLAGGLSLLAAAYLGVWMARGVVLSGYIAYPLPIGRVEVEWALPPEHIEDRQRALATNTRQRGGDSAQVLADWDWLRLWLERLAGSFFHYPLPGGIAAGSLALAAAGSWRQRGAPQTRPGWWILLPILIALALWFFSFPNPKYANYLMWSLAALSVTLAATVWREITLAWRLAGAMTLTGICLLYIVYLVLRAGTFPLPPGPADGFYQRAQPDLRVYKTHSGLELNMPRTGGQCWSLPLPCTPQPRRNLRLRESGNLGAGFVVASGQD